MWPEDDAVARRLKADPDFSEEKRMAEMHRFRREVTGLTLAYQHVLKVINCDQPNADVYLQGTDTAAMFGGSTSHSLRPNMAVNNAFHTLS